MHSAHSPWLSANRSGKLNVCHRADPGAYGTPSLHPAMVTISGIEATLSFAGATDMSYDRWSHRVTL